MKNFSVESSNNETYRKYIEEVVLNLSERLTLLEEIEGIDLFMLFTYSSWREDEDLYDKVTSYLEGAITILIENKDVSNESLFKNIDLLCTVDLLISYKLLSLSVKKTIAPIKEFLINKIKNLDIYNLNYEQISRLLKFLLPTYKERRQKNIYNVDISIFLIQLFLRLSENQVPFLSFYLKHNIESLLKKYNKEQIAVSIINKIQFAPCFDMLNNENPICVSIKDDIHIIGTRNITTFHSVCDYVSITHKESALALFLLSIFYNQNKGILYFFS